MSAGTLSENARTAMTAEQIHDLITDRLWRLNARAERIRGLGLCPALIRVELHDARVELYAFALQLGVIEREHREAAAAAAVGERV